LPKRAKKRLESLHRNLRIIVKTATGPSDQRKSLEELVATEQINALVILPIRIRTAHRPCS